MHELDFDAISEVIWKLAPTHFACQFSLLFSSWDSCRGHDSATRFLVRSHHLSRLKGQRLEGELLRHCPYDTSVRVEVNSSTALDLALHSFGCKPKAPL